MLYRFTPTRRSRQSRRAFTVLEVMVALGILAILLVIIVLPLRLGFDTFNVGNARSLTQSSLDSTMTQLATDLRQAVYVFPNAPTQGITGKAPYDDGSTLDNSPGKAQLPYYLSLNPANTGEPGNGALQNGNPRGVTCDTLAKSWSNTSRLDMIQVRRDANGNIISPLAPSYNIVTYYARRQELNKPYDPVDNPVVLYRAEYPAFGLFRGAGAPPNGTPAPLRVASVADAFNAQIDFPRINRRINSASGVPYPTLGTSCQAGPTATAATNRSALWLSHNVYGEADLLPLTGLGNVADPDSSDFDPAKDYETAGQSYSHTLAIPRGLALQVTNGFRARAGYAPPVYPSTVGEAPLVPDTTFTCADTNGDAKIDRVTISLGLASFQVGAQGELKNNQPVGTVLRATRSVDLPNIQ